MNSAYLLFSMLGEVMGTKARTFTVDYHDGKSYFNHEDTVLEPYRGCPDRLIVESLIEMHENQGYTVYGVVELLGGFSKNEAEKMMNERANDILPRLKLMYYDRDKEKLTCGKKHVTD